MQMKVSEIAARYRFSVDAIYAWVRTGLIPTCCILRVGNSIRIDSDQFDRLLQAGKLYRPRAADQRVLVPEDQSTIRGTEVGYSHRWTGEGGSVLEAHPYGPGPEDF